MAENPGQSILNGISDSSNNVPGASIEGTSEGTVTASAPVDLPSAIPDKYIEERNKRIRPEGTAQYLHLNNKYQHLNEDHWVDHAALNAKRSPLSDGDRCKFLMLGAGYGGLGYAARLIDAGFSANDMYFVDSAGGFGGTWYWNRYPGLMCDVESYTYMPFLEETGYMPKHKYSYGPELREHAERVAKHWKLENNALFRTTVKSLEWDEGEKLWRVSLTQNRGPGEQPLDSTIRADFVVVVSGVFGPPQIPGAPGLADFKGHIFHSSRWDYEYTGGSPEDQTMSNLKDKVVATIGTGATGIQVVPELAKWAKKLYVFQRTPSMVDTRDQRPTNPEEWKTKIASKKGWQRERQANFNSWVSNVPNGPNVVDDGWTRLVTYRALIGTPGIIGFESFQQFAEDINKEDLTRTNRLRTRVEEVVKDKDTAEHLKAWYNTWCKRPCFHDDYLKAFNNPNVTLIDTDGKGIEGFTPAGIMSGGKEYPVDLLVLSTGYRTSTKTNSPAERANISITGRNGLSLDDKWIKQGASTLHGLFTHDFPNLFFCGPLQAGTAANMVYNTDVLAEHLTYILSEAKKKFGTDRILVEPGKWAEEIWAGEIMKRATKIGVIATCTPSYINREGELGNMAGLGIEEMMKGLRAATWGEGINDFERVLKEWRDKGTLEGLEIEKVEGGYVPGGSRE